jgi:hypothetical protein
VKKRKERNCNFIIQQDARQYDVYRYNICIPTRFGAIAPSSEGHSHFHHKETPQIHKAITTKAGCA